MDRVFQSIASIRSVLALDMTTFREFETDISTNTPTLAADTLAQASGYAVDTQGALDQSTIRKRCRRRLTI